MTRPESSELRRNGLNDSPTHAVPEDNRPGHHPDQEQDRPDPQDFLERSHRRALDVASGGPDDGQDTNGDDTATSITATHRSLTQLLHVGASVAEGLGGAAVRMRRWAALPLRRVADVIDPDTTRSRTPLGVDDIEDE